MSKSLAPIHFWLYNKIGYQEELTSAIAEHAVNSGWIQDSAQYTKELPPLESVIDESNIHGWLQSQITDAETRYANLITDLLKSDETRLNEICGAAFAFGKEFALDDDTSAMEVYRNFANFFVNGMPCDHIDVLKEQGETGVTWEMARDIHARYWNGKTDNYYKIRKAIMDGMAESTEYCVTMDDPFHYSIQKK